MAKKKGYYSPEAFIGRAKEQAYQLSKQQEVAKPKEESTSLVGGDKQYVLPAVPQQSNPVVPNASPYMAQGTANTTTILGTQGTEPIYYTGRPREGWQGVLDSAVVNPLKNWMRRTWAAIHDPSKVLPNPTDAQLEEIDARVAQLKTKPINYMGHEVSAEKRADALDLIGLDLEEVLKSQATEEVSRKAGNSVNTGLVTRTASNVAWSAFVAVASAPEWVVRNGTAIAKTVDDVADVVAGKDKDSYIDAVGGRDAIEKFNQAVEDSEYSEVLKRVPAVAILKNADFLDVLYKMTPYEFFKDGFRLVANANKIQNGQFVKTLTTNLAGSQMIYTMLRDATKAEQFKQRYEAGENPIGLVMELQDWKTELAGGILFDPTTFTAKAAVEYADEGRRMFTKGIQSAAEYKIENALTDIRVPAPVKQAMDDFLTDTSVKTKDESIAAVRNIYKAVQDDFVKWSNKRGLTSALSTDKQKIVIEQATEFFQSLAANARKLPNGMDELTEVIASMKKLAVGGEGAEEAFLHLAKGTLGEQVLSPRGMRMANIISSFDDVMPAVQKAIDEGDISKLANVYADKISQFADRTILSVDELAAASSRVDEIVRKIGGEENVVKARQAISDVNKIKDEILKIRQSLSEAKTFKNETKKAFAGEVQKLKAPIESARATKADFVKNIDNQIKDLEIQRKAMKSLPKDEKTKLLSEVNEAIGELKGLKKSIGEDLSKKVDELKNPLLSMTETQKAVINNIQERLNKVDNVLKAMSQQKEDALLRVAELNSEKGQAKNLIAQLDEQMKRAEDFKKLPAYVKFFNSANNLGKRTWMKPLGFLAQFYFGLNRFAYPTRNVMGAVVGMGYEGLEIAEIAGKAIVGSQIEKIGVRLLENTTAEINKILGYVPPAALRGDTPVGEFVDASKKILGVIRSGSEVAQLSEQIMSSQIMLKTIKREVSNAIKYGAIPDPAELVRAGLNAEDSKMLLKYAAEYQGDTNKILDAFRIYMGGAEESFRHLPMPQKLNQFLDDIGNGTSSLSKELMALRETAKTPAEFAEGAQAIWSKVETIADVSRSDPVNLSDDVERLIGAEVGNARMLHSVSEEGLDNFERQYQAFHNARRLWVDAETRMINFLISKGANIDEFSPLISKAKNSVEDYSRTQPAQRLVNRIYDDKTLTPKEMYKMLDEELAKPQILDSAGNPVSDEAVLSFKISDYTQVDPTKISRRQMESIMWESYYAWKGKYFSQKTDAHVTEMVGIIDSMIGDIALTRGVKYDIPRVARESGANYQEALDSFHYAQQVYAQTSIDTMSYIRRKVPEGVTLQDLDIGSIKDYGFKSASHLFNEINRYRKSVGEEAWQTFSQVEMWEVQDAVRRIKRAEGFVPANPELTTWEKIIHPPIAPDKPAGASRIIAESSKFAKKDFDRYIQSVVNSWGEIKAPAGALTDDVEMALSGWVSKLNTNMANVRNEAGQIATATRDALLYDYRKQLWQVAAQYVSPFSYFHTSALNQWFRNAAADPKWAAIYIDFKESMANRHAGMPDQWKSNIAVDWLPGTDKAHPVFFNIEASVNPLYQMIGQNFDDPNMRKDWLSTTVDDLGKVIPGIYAPIQWAISANLSIKGEEEAAALWRGRLIPQTRLLKTASTALGIEIPGIKYNELDPFVQVFDGGLDPREEKKALRYLATMPGITEEQRIEAAHMKSGKIWDAAVKASLSARAPAEMMSYFLGVGYKPRTQEDVTTDQFYDEYRKLLAARSIMDKDAYRDAWDALRVEYPFMDTMLIGRKAGEESDTAYAYNVLNRIPPGETTDIAKFVNIEPYMLEQFYDNKGDMTKMLPQDKARFMAAMVDMSAMLKMPTGATKQEWNSAKETYASMNDELKKSYGENILEMMDTYLSPDMTSEEKSLYLEANPDVQKALQDRDAYIVSTPILSAYYASLSTVTRFYDNKAYAQLEKEYGQDIRQVEELYYFYKDSMMTKEAKAVYKENNLKAYFKRKKELLAESATNVIGSADQIPDGKSYEIRPEFQAKSDIQQDTLGYISTDQQSQIAEQLWSELTPAAQELIQEYFATGEELPYSVKNKIDYIAGKYGLSEREAMILLGVEQP